MPDNQPLRRNDIRKVRSIVLLVTRMVVACSLMIWGAMNLATNVRGLMATGLEDGLFSSVGLSMAGLILATAALPIVIGIVLLMRFDSGIAKAASRSVVESGPESEQEA